jgi:hypothetical protein
VTPPIRPRSTRPIAIVMVIAGVAVAFTAMGVPMGIATLGQYGPTGPLFILIFPAIVLSLTLVGGFVAARVGNPVGWLLELSGLAAAIGIFGGTYVNYDHAVGAGLPFVVPIAWLSSWTMLPGLGMLLVYVPMLFPTGRFLGRRWRRFGLAGLIGIAGTLATAFLPGPLASTPWIENPLGLPGATDVLNAITVLSNLSTPVFFGGAVISVFVRYRTAGMVERQQLKWFGLVAGVTVVTFLVSIPNNGPVSDAAWAIGLAMLPLLPVAIGVAILRYHLWDIDRIISRTIGWGLVTGVVVGTFGAAVIALDTVLAGFTQSQTLAVAASTLMAFAAFQPVRRRIQRAVDRRFDRVRYDGQQAVEAFAMQLRDQVDLLAIEHGALATVKQTVRPAHADLWLRRKTGQQAVARARSWAP